MPHAVRDNEVRVNPQAGSTTSANPGPTGPAGSLRLGPAPKSRQQPKAYLVALEEGRNF